MNRHIPLTILTLTGDSMNTSSRMESTCRPGCIQISDVTYQLLNQEDRNLFVTTGGVEVKVSMLPSCHDQGSMTWNPLLILHAYYHSHLHYHETCQSLSVLT